MRKPLALWSARWPLLLISAKRTTIWAAPIKPPAGPPMLSASLRARRAIETVVTCHRALPLRPPPIGVTMNENYNGEGIDEKTTPANIIVRHFHPDGESL